MSKLNRLVRLPVARQVNRPVRLPVVHQVNHPVRLPVVRQVNHPVRLPVARQADPRHHKTVSRDSMVHRPVVHVGRAANAFRNSIARISITFRIGSGTTCRRRHAVIAGCAMSAAIAFSCR